jgi:hypothetical protein
MKTGKTTNKPKKLNVEFSVEITGEDAPTKFDKRRERWAMIALLSFVVSVAFLLLFFLVEINSFTTIGTIVSFAVFVIAICRSGDIDPDEPTGLNPWWWGL